MYNLKCLQENFVHNPLGNRLSVYLLEHWCDVLPPVLRLCVRTCLSYPLPSLSLSLCVCLSEYCIHTCTHAHTHMYM